MAHGSVENKEGTEEQNGIFRVWDLFNFMFFPFHLIMK
jgi:hypothetical protein